MKSAKISSKQLIAMMLLSRLFILLIYVPSSRHVAEGSASLLIILTSYLFTFVAMIPAWLLLKHYPRLDMAGAAAMISPKLKKPVAALFYILCLAVAAETMAQFELFMTTVIYPQANKIYVTLIFAAAVVYMVYLGLEAITRASLVVLVLVVATALILFFGLARFIDTVCLFTPLYDGVKPIVMGTFLGFAQNTELVALVLLLPYLNTEKPAKSFAWFSSLSSLALAAVGFVAITVLGNYGKTRSFPVYTLSAISGSEIFYRFDFFHIVAWVSISMMRAALYLFLASQLLSTLTNGKLGKWVYAVNVVIVTAVAIVCSQSMEVFSLLYRATASGLPIYLLLAVLPLILLFMRALAKKKKGGGA